MRDLLELIEDPISLETPVGDGESVYSDLIEDQNADLPEDTTAEGMRSRELAKALALLNPRMRLVIAQRFGLDGQTRRRWSRSAPSSASPASGCASSSRGHCASSARTRPSSSSICDRS